MDAKTSETGLVAYHFGELLAEGKTKKIFGVKHSPELAILVAKDDITAGDGKKHDIIPQKAELATRTTCNVFRLLNAGGVKTAFIDQTDKTSFVARKCDMLPYEIVTRREAHGSYLKRNPHIKKGQIFPKLLVEFYLKTKDRKWKAHELVCDDPYMVWTSGQIELYNPAAPLAGQKPFLVLKEDEIFTAEDEWKLLREMDSIARDVFLTLEKAWQLQGRTLVDMKVEFGLDSGSRLLLADVIDNDSWRVLENGAYIDKQLYRDGGSLSEVAETYARVAQVTGNFTQPVQRIILWAGSDKDDLEPFKALRCLSPQAFSLETIVCSVHKEPTKALRILQRLLQEVPDSVIIAYIGRSNGAGPVLSAQTTVPVITVPVDYKEFPEDAWSSLRAPSLVPVLTVLEPQNAVLAALNILSARNPCLYATVRGGVEDRLENLLVVPEQHYYSA